MIFTSFRFFFFLAGVTLIYYLLPQRARTPFLLAASTVFYACWNLAAVGVLAAQTVVTYLCAQRTLPGALHRHAWLNAAIALDVGSLALFKYTSFLLDNLSQLLRAFQIPMDRPALNLLLPVGISFFTFRNLSYLLDTARGKYQPWKSLPEYALYVSFFPQIASGPIERPDSFLPQLARRQAFSLGRLACAVEWMLLGFFKKIVIADGLARVITPVYGSMREHSGPMLVICMLLYSIQIYCDFAGYSEIAVGCGVLLGFDPVDNFRSPYLSTSVKEFWNRWHISLSTWLRDYVYIPLGGSRCALVRQCLNLLITFAVSGLWHGADWKFVVWGTLHGALLVLYTLWSRFKKAHPTLPHLPEALGRAGSLVLTYLVVSAAWVFFSASSIGDAWYLLTHLFTPQPQPLLQQFFALNFGRIDMAVMALMLALLVVIDVFGRDSRPVERLAKLDPPARTAVVYVLLFSLLLFGTYGPGYNSAAFIYFNF